MNNPNNDKKDYPCYKIIKGEQNLEQGDIIEKCIVTVPDAIKLLELNQKIKDKDINTQAKLDEFISNNEVDLAPSFNIERVIILSQSCDLVKNETQNPIDVVQVCQIFPYQEFKNKGDYWASSKCKENLAKGNEVGYHLLHECKEDGYQLDYSISQFLPNLWSSL